MAGSFVFVTERKTTKAAIEASTDFKQRRRCHSRKMCRTGDKQQPIASSEESWEKPWSSRPV